MRRIINEIEIRIFNLLYFIRGELEIRTYRRRYLKEKFDLINIILFLIFIFIDGFRLYYNIYRLLIN